MPIIVSAFPGTGKSTFQKVSKYIVADSDSSKFPKNGFPRNYIEYIKGQMDCPEIDFILVSSHKDVRDELLAENIPYNLVYPDRSLKDEYLRRYEKRGSSHQFIELIANKWDEWLDEMEAVDDPTIVKYRLIQGQYLSDVIGVL